jgi:hypothetical protein
MFLARLGALVWERHVKASAAQQTFRGKSPDISDSNMVPLTLLLTDLHAAATRLSEIRTSYSPACILAVQIHVRRQYKEAVRLMSHLDARDENFLFVAGLLAVLSARLIELGVEVSEPYDAIELPSQSQAVPPDPAPAPQPRRSTVQ